MIPEIIKGYGNTVPPILMTRLLIDSLAGKKTQPDLLKDKINNSSILQNTLNYIKNSVNSVYNTPIINNTLDVTAYAQPALLGAKKVFDMWNPNSIDLKIVNSHPIQYISDVLNNYI